MSVFLLSLCLTLINFSFNMYKMKFPVFVVFSLSKGPKGHQEEQRELDRLSALAEEMAAESRTPYDDREKVFDLRKQNT